MSFQIRSTFLVLEVIWKEQCCVISRLTSHLLQFASTRVDVNLCLSFCCRHPEMLKGSNFRGWDYESFSHKINAYSIKELSLKIYALQFQVSSYLIYKLKDRLKDSEDTIYILTVSLFWSPLSLTLNVPFKGSC